MSISMLLRLARASGLLVASGILAIGCATQPVEPPAPVPPPPPPPRHSGPSQPAPDAIDLRQVQRALGMERRPNELGYREKKFNACKLGIQKSGSCRDQMLIVVHFLLECRDTEGTVQGVYRHDVQPIRSDELAWHLGAQEGMTESDRDGYGQVVTAAATSQKNQRFRITYRGKFLSLTASEVKRMVTPKDWCE